MSTESSPSIADAELVKRLRHGARFAGNGSQRMHTMLEAASRLEQLSREPHVTESVTDEDIRICLDEFNDHAEMNTPETNMRAALETFAYRKAALGQNALTATREEPKCSNNS